MMSNCFNKRGKSLLRSKEPLSEFELCLGCGLGMLWMHDVDDVWRDHSVHTESIGL